MDFSGFEKFRIILKMTIAGHLQSSRFVILMTVIFISFVGAIIKALWSAFPYAVLVGVLNGAAVISYITKTMEPGAQSRRNEAKKEKEIL